MSIENIMKAITTTTNANTNNEQKEETTMTKKSTTRPEGYTKSAWEKATYTAYMGLIAIVERRATIAQYLKANAALFTGCGMPADESHVLSLVISMAKDATVDHEKVRKVNSIGSLRQFFNGAWVAKDALAVSYKAPAVPKEPKPRQPKAKKTPEETMKSLFSKMTPEQQAAMIAQLLTPAA